MMGTSRKSTVPTTPDEFEFLNGCIRLRIKGLGETTLDEWMRTQIMLHSIGVLPEDLIETALTKTAIATLIILTDLNLWMAASP